VDIASLKGKIDALERMLGAKPFIELAKREKGCGGFRRTRVHTATSWARSINAFVIKLVQLGRRCVYFTLGLRSS
jgi:hypothetical protein